MKVAGDNPSTADRIVTLTSIVDDGGSGGYDVDTTTLSVRSTVHVQAVNDAPSGADMAITTGEGSTYHFTAADFGFSDVDGNQLSRVKISGLPGSGALPLDGAAVHAGDVIAADKISGLAWAPAGDANGDALASFDFQVIDDGGTLYDGVNMDQIANTITFNVTPVDVAPTLSATTTNTTFTEGGSPAKLFSNVAADTGDSEQVFTSINLEVDRFNRQTGSEYLDTSAGRILIAAGDTALAGFGTVHVTDLYGADYITISGFSLNASSMKNFVESIGYVFDGDNMPDNYRSVAITGVTDSGGTNNATLLSLWSTVVSVDVNAPPTVTATTSTPTFTENGPAVDLFSAVSVDVIEMDQKTKALTFTVSGLHDGSNEQVVVDGTTFSLTDGTSGDTSGLASVHYAASMMDGVASVTLTSSSGLSDGLARMLIDGLAYKNASDDPDTSDRVFALTSIKDNGGTTGGGIDTTSLSIASTVHVASSTTRRR